jgi:acetyl-CoA synthetase
MPEDHRNWAFHKNTVPGGKMRDYHEAYNEFSIAALARDTLAGTLDGGLNACVECCDRWADRGRIALEWVSRDFKREPIGFATLRDDAARFANLLTSHGIGPGDIVAGLLPKVPELLVVILGTWRAGAVYQALFTAFGPDGIQSRVTGATGSGAKLIVTDAINQPKLNDVKDCPPTLVIDRGVNGRSDFTAALAAQPASFEPVMRKGNDPFIMIYTSGTTGNAKGVAMPLEALLQFAVFMRDGMDVRPDDVFWGFADPGWALGLYAGIAGPLLLGQTVLLYDGSFSVDSTVRMIAELKVTNLLAAPTVFRMLRAAGDAAVAPIAHQLRVITSGGEPVNPEVVQWAERVLHCPIHEAWGQTEMGVTTCNHHGLRHPMKPGSIGTASPGFRFAILDDDLKPLGAGEAGVMAVDRAGSPLFFFDGYWRAETPAIRGNWYLTGDTMYRDDEGYFYFVGRNDDLITSSGYRIGPSDIEGIIIGHPAVAEVAVIGKPDAERTEIVKAFVVLREGHDASDALATELQQLVRSRLAAHAYPREVAFMASLPKTPSGKVQRFVLRRMG